MTDLTRRQVLQGIIATIPDEAVKGHVEMPPDDEAADGGNSEIARQASEIINSAAPESFEIGEAQLSHHRNPQALKRNLLTPRLKRRSELMFARRVRRPVSGEATSSHVTYATPDDVPELDNQTSETDITMAAESPVESVVTTTDQPQPAAIEQETSSESIDTPLGFGIIDEIYNVADATSRSSSQGRRAGSRA